MNRVVARVLVGVSLCVAAGACRSDKGAPGAQKPGAGRVVKFPVQAETVTAREMEFVINAVGSVEAFETVQVTARVAGAVERVRFVEGQLARPAQVLVEIEPRRYHLAVEAARAALEKAKASQADAESGLARRENAVAGAPGLIPAEEIETWRTRLRTAQAEVTERQVALSQAELNRKDALVRSPVTGIIETRNVETGQHVQPGVVLATIVRRDPLLLRFGVPASDAAELRPGIVARFRTRGDDKSRQAKITHVARAADSTTRMVAVAANVFAEDAAAVRPGAFAEVTIAIGAPRPTAVVPETAVRPTERGFVAYVVEGDVAKERILTLGLRTPDGQVEVKDGIRVGDRVVVRGAEALRDGAQVTVEAPGKDVGGSDPGDAGSLHP